MKKKEEKKGEMADIVAREAGIPIEFLFRL